MTDERFGVVPIEIAATKTGREFLEGSLDGTFPGPPIAEGGNFRLTEVGDGTVTFEGEPGPQHRNPMGMVHGGWALTLIDSACGCAGLSTLPAGINFTTLETKANFTRAIAPDGATVRAVGTVIAGGKTIITTEARVTDADGRLLAHGTSTLLVLRPR